MKKTLLAAAIAALLSSGSALAQDAAPAFNDAQKKEIEKIIQDYIMSNPKIVMDAAQKFQANQEEMESQAMEKAIKDKAEALYNDPATPVAGNPKGDVTLVEFFDYNCGYCKIAFKDVQTLVNEDKNLKVVFKEIPILSETSNIAARYALAANKQGKYWEFHAALMGTSGGISETMIDQIGKDLKLDMTKLKADADSAEIRAEIEKNMDLARELGITGTPGFVIADKPLRGHYGVDAMRKLISEARGAKPE